MNDGILEGEKENRIDFKATVRMSLCCTRQHHIVLRDSEINRHIIAEKSIFKETAFNTYVPNNKRGTGTTSRKSR